MFNAIIIYKKLNQIFYLYNYKQHIKKLLLYFNKTMKMLNVIFIVLQIKLLHRFKILKKPLKLMTKNLGNK